VGTWHDADPGRPIAAPLERCAELLGVDLATVRKPAGQHRALRRAEVGNLPRSTRHHGRVPEVDDDQLAALRRLRAAFGPIEIIEVISHDPGDDLAAPQGEPIKGDEDGRPQADDA
jgi:hypothetical protein